MKIRAFAFSALLLPSIAAADDRGDFVSLDRQGTDNTIGLAVSGHFVSSDAAPDFGLRENLFGRYVDRRGFGGYGQLSFSHVFGDDSNESAIGALELGGLYVLHAGGGDVILRLGLGLPTASSSLTGMFTNMFASTDRLQDVALTAPDVFWLRPGVAARFGGPKLFFQLDAGIDIPIETSDDVDAEVLLHANAGVGTTQGPVAITAELANYAYDSDDFHALHSVAVSARLAKGRIQPFVAYTMSFSLEDNGPDAAHAVTAGAQAAF